MVACNEFAEIQEIPVKEKSSASQPPISEPHGPQERTPGWDCTNWDLNTQQPHGGQEWNKLDNFEEDFSVTTNVLGPPWKAVTAAASSLQHVDHYPAANYEPNFTDLARFMDPVNYEQLKPLLMLGNGASELIDLVTRVGANPGDICIPYTTQYMEYERAALAMGRDKVEDPLRRAFSILAIVNPCNPTGEYKEVAELKAYIEKICTPGTTVLVDESMQPWVGPNWRSDSLITQREWVTKLLNERDIRIFVIHSWTKIWSCPGIRLGSVIGPSSEDIVRIKSHQVPWSLNICALAFLSAAIADDEYMEHTWSITTAWRKRTVDKIKELHPTWTIHGKSFLSWLWIDCHDEEEASTAVERSRQVGCPIRHGAMGYEMPTFIRIAVRAPKKQDILFKALAF